VPRLDGVRVRFANKKLLALYETEAGARKYPGAVVAAFFEVIEAIRAAKDERDLYALKSLHFEALKGNRADQRSVRLNKQFRLILRIETDPSGNIILVIELEDYHR